MRSAVQSNRKSKPRPGNRAQDYWLYLRTCLLRGSQIASLAPSSRWTAQAMLQGIDFQQAKTIVELGAGTGALTAELLEAAGEHCRIIAIERDAAFCKRLRERWPHEEIIEGDAIALRAILARLNVGQVDHIVCSVPLNWLNSTERDSLLSTVRDSLREGGSFRQLTHLPGVHRSLYAQYFDEVRCELVLLNLPPAGCYICRNPRP